MKKPLFFLLQQRLGEEVHRRVPGQRSHGPRFQREEVLRLLLQRRLSVGHLGHDQDCFQAAQFRSDPLRSTCSRTDFLTIFISKISNSFKLLKFLRMFTKKKNIQSFSLPQTVLIQTCYNPEQLGFFLERTDTKQINISSFSFFF